jgi:hypothetical protein
MIVNLAFKLWNCQPPSMMYMVYFPGVFRSSYKYILLDKSKRLVLMTYYGVVLSLSGYQADGVKVRAQYKAIVDRYVSFIQFRFQLSYL